jgi:hypothetical protein
MLVLNLCCRHDHRFEGWFASADDFESQLSRGLLLCPNCGDEQVRRLPTAARLNISGKSAKQDAEPNPVTAAEVDDLPRQLQRAALQAVRQALSRSEDVGERFAEEARRIHYGEAEERSIRGRASRDETLALADEGIEVLALPDGLGKTLQ